MEFFKNKLDPSMNELIYWFQVEYVGLTNSLKASNHNTVPDEPNPYHIEDSVWTHTMLVCQRAEIFEVHKINKICALMHDLGKPIAEETIPFEAKKPVHSESNKLRNDDKNSDIQRVIPKSGLKKHFRGHEGLSFYLAIEPLNRLKDLGVLTQKEVEQCLTVISMHGTLFDNINSDGTMRKPGKVFEKFENSEDGLFLFNTLVTQVKCDSLGRFYVSKDGRKSNAYKLGTEIFTEEQFLEYHTNKPPIYNTQDCKPQLEVLVGAPGSGKSTYLENKEENYVVISRDNTLVRYAAHHNINGNYSEVWKQLTDDDQKAIDKHLEDDFKRALNNKENMVIDMTNMSNKSQRKWVNKCGNKYRAKAVVFATSYNEIQRRLKKREKETEKSIPDFVIKTMMKGFGMPNFTTFREIDWVF